MKMVILAVAAVSVLAGCVTMPPEKMPITTEQREFIFEYAAPNKSKKELFTAARNYFAMAYGNSKEVSRLEDEDQGTIIGKAIVGWRYTIDEVLSMAVPCASNYSIIFVAKDAKARLQLTLTEGIAYPMTCGWALPPKRDYPQIVESFKAISKGLGNSIEGNSAVDKLKNF